MVGTSFSTACKAHPIKGGHQGYSFSLVVELITSHSLFHGYLDFGYCSQSIVHHSVLSFELIRKRKVCQIFHFFWHNSTSIQSCKQLCCVCLAVTNDTVSFSLKIALPRGQSSIPHTTTPFTTSLTEPTEIIAWCAAKFSH